MNKTKIIVILVAALLAIAVPVSISASNESARSEPPTKTNQNESFLKKHDIVLKTPANKPKISEQEAIQLALKYCDALKPTDSNIVVEYQLMTFSNFRDFSETAKSKNPRLKEDGYLNNTPVYIVTLKGLNFQSMGGRAIGSKLEPITLHEKNVVVDADTGEILLTYSYQ